MYESREVTRIENWNKHFRTPHVTDVFWSSQLIQKTNRREWGADTSYLSPAFLSNLVHISTHVKTRSSSLAPQKWTAVGLLLTHRFTGHPAGDFLSQAKSGTPFRFKLSDLNFLWFFFFPTHDLAPQTRKWVKTLLAQKLFLLKECSSFEMTRVRVSLFWNLKIE